MLHVLASSYQKPIQLRIFIDCFLSQTNPNWSLTVIHDGQAEKEVKDVFALYNDPRILCIETEKREKYWGNIHRQEALQLINGKKGDFVLLTNADNYYVPHFVQVINDTANNDVGFIYCDFLHHNYGYALLRSKIEVNYIDLGCFVTELKLAQSIGFHRLTRYDADGLFAKDVANFCDRNNLKTIKLPNVLFVHN